MTDDSIATDVGSPKQIEDIRESLTPVLGLEWSQVPYWREGNRYIHLTCAGKKLNQAITAWAGEDPKSATELTLSLAAPLDLSTLPRTVERFADHLLAVSALYTGELSVFQSLLPHDLLAAERLDWWFKTPALKRALGRLINGSLSPVGALKGLNWGTSVSVRESRNSSTRASSQ